MCNIFLNYFSVILAAFRHLAVYHSVTMLALLPRWLHFGRRLTSWLHFGRRLTSWLHFGRRPQFCAAICSKTDSKSLEINF